MPTPPSFRKVNPADQPILYLALTSPTLPLSTLNEYGETLMAQRISMVSGVAQVQVYRLAEISPCESSWTPRPWPPAASALIEVADAMGGANVNLPTGMLYGPQQAFTVQASGQLMHADPYRSMVVAYRDGPPVRLGDLGAVIDSVENNKTAAWYVDQRAIVLAVQRQPGTNTVEVASAVKKLLPAFQAQMPASVSLNVLYDRSMSIRESVHDVKFTLLLTLALVMLVIFLFLRKLSATLIPSLAMPMSIVGTFAVMYLLEIQPRQPLAHGVDPGGRLRGGRRHRHAGEHRPAHRNGRGTGQGGFERLQGDRLHHRVHDPLAGGGLHPGSVHGRHPGPAVQRIRRHHRRGHSHFGGGLPDPHAHALQPFPEARMRNNPPAGSTMHPRRSTTGCWGCTSAACAGSWNIAASPWLSWCWF